MYIDSSEALTACLQAVEARREARAVCELTPELSAKLSDAALVELLVTALPMAQGIQHRIVRSRGRGAVLTAKIRYRDGVRMLAGVNLTPQEAASLEAARSVAEEAIRQGGEEARFAHVYDWLCRNTRYVHTAPGRKGYERLVGAASVIQDRQANCQGFADALYLLCGLCGVACEYRCGWGERKLHLWNVVCIDGKCRDVDASKGARSLLGQQTATALPEGEPWGMSCGRA